jgi:MFS family permease
MLVVFRVLQGLGGGMLMPLGMTILTHEAGPERLGRVMAILGVPMLLGPIFGPILGGWLIDVASWHWIFLINVPIGVGAAIYAYVVLDKDHVEPSESFDFVGMLLLSPGLAMFLYGVSSIPAAKAEHGTMWTTQVVAFSLVGLALIVAFVPWALRKHNVHPLVQLRLFKNRYMTIAVITMALFAMAFFGASLLFTLYFQQVRGLTPLQSGWLVAPQGFGAMLTMPIAGFMADKIGPGKVVLTGLVFDTVGMGMMVHVDDRHRLRGDGARHGRDDDAGLHRGARQPARSRRGARLDPDEHHPTDRHLGRHRPVLGAAHQRLRPARDRREPDARPPERRRPRLARPEPGAGRIRDGAGSALHGHGVRRVLPRRDGAGRALSDPGVLPAAEADRAPGGRRRRAGRLSRAATCSGRPAHGRPGRAASGPSADGPHGAIDLDPWW